MKRIKRYTLAKEEEVLMNAIVIQSNTGNMVVEAVGQLLTNMVRVHYNRHEKSRVAEAIALVRIRLRQLELINNCEAAAARFRDTQLSKLECELRGEDDGERVEEEQVRQSVASSGGAS